MSTILLSGATGFLGSHLLQAFLKNGHKIIILKRNNSDTSRIDHIGEKFFQYNIDTYNIEKVFEENNIDIVVHTACNYGKRNESIVDIAYDNLIFGIKLLDAAIKFEASTFINTDTFLPKNVNDYSLSKRQFTEWLEEKSEHINVINFKLEYMYGEWDNTDSLVPWIISSFLNNKDEIKLTSGNQKRDFIYVSDVVDAFLVAINNLNKLTGFNNFDLGTGSLVSLKEFIFKIKELYELNIKKSATTLNFGAIPHKKNEEMLINLNNKPLQELGWHAKFNIDDGLTKTIKELVTKT